MSEPSVSIIMAVYSGEKLICPTIESILGQTLKDFEFVIVDDGSSDSTRSIVQSYNDSRIILHGNACNIGQTASLNVGLNISKGKYIARIDAGDVALPERLKCQCAFMKSNPEYAVVGTSAFRYDHRWRMVDVAHMPMSSSQITQLMFFTSPLVHISVMMQRAPIMDMNGYDEKFKVLADYDLWSRLIRKRYGIANIRTILSGYMVSDQSFGALNRTGISADEAGYIIQKNTQFMTGKEISLKQARNIYLMFNNALELLPIEKILEAQHLFRELMNSVGGNHDDTDYVIMSKYLSYVMSAIRGKSDNRCFKHAMRFILSRALRFDIQKKCLGNVYTRWMDTMRWRTRVSDNGVCFPGLELLQWH